MSQAVFEDPYSDSAWHEFRITFTAQWIDVNTNYWLGSATVAPSPWGDTACDLDVWCRPATGALSVHEASSY